MPNREELIDALAQLDPATFEDVITSAYRQRYSPDNVAPSTGPDPQATARQFAEWLAKRHMASDPAIERVVFLPTGAPDHEIRLLEVNRLLSLPEPEAIEPLDFTPETDLPYRVYVADIASDQWDRIQRDPDALLPPGWRLDNYLVIGRG